MIDPVTVTPLRQRMIEDMTIRRFGEHTQRDYVRQVREFTAFLGLPPDRAEPEDLRRYQLHMASLGASYARMNLACTALRFFFHVTLGRTGFGDRMARIPTPDRLPVVLDTQEVALLLAHARSLKDRAALSIAYGCGLRVSEIANLKVADIDSARMLIRVEQGKGRKDRYVMLAPDLLDLLRQWWRVKRPRGWLFPGQQPGQPITTRQLTPSRLHPAGPDRGHRVPEQGRGLWSAVPGRSRDARHHRERSPASRRSHRLHLGAAYMGIGDDPSSPSPHHRARRRPLA